MYELIYNSIDGKVEIIRRLSDNACIPLCEGNTDYQDFLEWNKEQATPLDMKSTISIPGPTDEQRVESLIQAKMREQAITALKIEGVLTADGMIAERAVIIK